MLLLRHEPTLSRPLAGGGRGGTRMPCPWTVYANARGIYYDRARAGELQCSTVPDLFGLGGLLAGPGASQPLESVAGAVVDEPANEAEDRALEQ